jgi:hypothetical protein
MHRYWELTGPELTDEMQALTGQYHHRLENLLVDSYCQRLGIDVAAERLRKAHADALLGGALRRRPGHEQRERARRARSCAKRARRSPGRRRVPPARPCRPARFRRRERRPGDPAAHPGVRPVDAEHLRDHVQATIVAYDVGLVRPGA